MKAADKILHIDSKVLEEAESREEAGEIHSNGDAEESGDAAENGDTAPRRKLSKKEFAEALRQKVDTIGRPGKPGAGIQKVISVGMLSEGWDAKTVPHIMGLRAFTSQLLCEQVVGRGLRRTLYEFDPNTLITLRPSMSTSLVSPLPSCRMKAAWILRRRPRLPEQKSSRCPSVEPSKSPGQT